MCEVPDCGKPVHARGLCPQHYQNRRRHGDVVAPERGRDVLDRLADKMLIGDECWEWIATRSAGGYGMVYLDGRMQQAHRVVYELLIGPIPDDLTLDHLCKNPGCVRPAHMEPTTIAVNILRGDGACALNARKTHCKRGHPFDDENTIWINGGAHRRCRTCKKEQYARVGSQ